MSTTGLSRRNFVKSIVALAIVPLIPSEPAAPSAPVERPVRLKGAVPLDEIFYYAPYVPLQM